jgi:hypothetical protein
LGWALKAVVRPVMAKRVATVVTDFMVLDIFFEYFCDGRAATHLLI